MADQSPETKNSNRDEQLDRPENPRQKSRRRFVIILVVAVLIVGALLFWWHSTFYEDTDDAQVSGHLVQVSSRIAGQVIKVNVDENPAISGSFQVKSIPAVFALKDGKVVDGFIGALPEEAVAEFVAKLTPAPSEADLLVDEGVRAGTEEPLRILCMREFQNSLAESSHQLLAAQQW